ncbi:MAG: hypothetical protein PSV18_01825 [Methylobacter sp.]|nr:hypothetical protein [Candidatus Methylobacter titanis]
MTKSKPKTQNDTHQTTNINNDAGIQESIGMPSFLLLKRRQANKTGKRSKGYIHYLILSDPTHQALYITITGNDGGGFWSKEIVPFKQIEDCLQGVSQVTPITSKIFQNAFIGRSANNNGFLAAVLRAEKLLSAVPDAAHQHHILPNWQQWKQAMFALATHAEIYQPEPVKLKGGKNSNKSTTAETTTQENSIGDHPHEQQAHNSSTHQSTESTQANHTEPAELDDAEMALLQCIALDTDPTDQEEVESNATQVQTLLDKNHVKKQRRDKRENSNLDEETGHDSAS